MNPATIAQLRLRHQQLLATDFRTPAEIVGHLGAMQAQDYPMSKWAVGVRLPGSTDAQIEAALDRAEIIRTHVLRPTWHLVAATDLRWLLALTAPHVKIAMGANDRRLGLTPEMLTRATALLEKTLADGHHRTRAELAGILNQAGFPTHENRPAHYMMHAELDAVVCQGVRRGNESTYALVDQRIGPTPTLPRDEARAALARRYFLSHGPATLADFAWWSGLPMGDARAGLEAVKHLLAAETHGKQTWWGPTTTPPTVHPSLLLLPCFDEYTVSYKDRSAIIHAEHAPLAMTSNGIFKPIIVRDGRVVGLWRRAVVKKQLRLEPTFFETADAERTPELQAATARYGAFLGCET